ncbi:MAG: hypothetical protein R2750_13430 [Bacteroidales bacterium]
MKNIITILLIIITASLAQTQEVRSSLGLRGGGTSGITFKYIDADDTGFELIAGWREGGFRLTGLLQKYKPIATNKVPNLNLVTGIGAHAGYIHYDMYANYYHENYYYYGYYTKTKPVIGIDAMAAVEYHFESVPIQFSIDYKPYMEFFGKKGFRVDLWDFGFSLRYMFNS